MAPFTRVLAATDFSDSGNAAVRAAFRIVSGERARVDLLHVAEPAHIPNPLYAHYTPHANDPEAHAEAVARIEKELAKLVPAEAKKAKVAVETHVREGAPAAEIVALAEERKAELIVVGACGHGGLERLLIGSVVDRVLRTAHTNVLVVRA